VFVTAASLKPQDVAGLQSGDGFLDMCAPAPLLTDTVLAIE
jgi:hypothetical protein